MGQCICKWVGGVYSKCVCLSGSAECGGSGECGRFG